MPYVNCNPEAFGLTVIGTAQDDSVWYEFDEFTAWRDAEGNFLWASDSGCSCDEPFENLDLDDLSKGTAAQAHAALDEWASSDPDKASSTADLHLKISQQYVATAELPARESYIPD